MSIPALIAKEFNGQGSLLISHLFSFFGDPITYPSLRPGILKILVKLLKTNKLSNLWVNGIKDSFSPLGVIDKKASSQITNLNFFIIFHILFHNI